MRGGREPGRKSRPQRDRREAGRLTHKPRTESHRCRPHPAQYHTNHVTGASRASAAAPVRGPQGHQRAEPVSRVPMTGASRASAAAPVRGPQGHQRANPCRAPPPCMRGPGGHHRAMPVSRIASRADPKATIGLCPCRASPGIRASAGLRPPSGQARVALSTWAKGHHEQARATSASEPRKRRCSTHGAAACWAGLNRIANRSSSRPHCIAVRSARLPRRKGGHSQRHGRRSAGATRTARHPGCQSSTTTCFCHDRDHDRRSPPRCWK